MAPFDILETQNDTNSTGIDGDSMHYCVRNTSPGATLTHSTTVPYEIYDGGYEHNRGVCVRIANGTAGQVGLIREWANAFIQEMVNQGREPFQVSVD